MNSQLQNELLEIRNQIDELIDLIQNPYGNIESHLDKYSFLSQRLEDAIRNLKNS